MIKVNPYRISPSRTLLEERAFILAEKMQKDEWAVQKNEEELLGLLKDAGFKRSYHCHSFYPRGRPFEFKPLEVNCDNFFLRKEAVALIRISTTVTLNDKLNYPPLYHGQYRKECSGSKFWVIPGGKEVLNKIERFKKPWYERILENPLRGGPNLREYWKEISALEVRNPTDSLLYIARAE